MPQTVYDVEVLFTNGVSFTDSTTHARPHARSDDQCIVLDIEHAQVAKQLVLSRANLCYVLTVTREQPDDTVEESVEGDGVRVSGPTPEVH